MKYFLLFLFSFLVITGCINNTNKPLCTTTYQFEIPLSVYPQLDTFKLGDTIWLESTLPNMIEDKTSNEVIDIKDFDFKTKIGIGRIDTAAIIFADFLFEHINQVGELQITSNTNTNVIFQQNNNNKVLKVGVIPSEIGGFQIGFYNFTEDLYDVSLTDTSCIQIVELSYNMNDGDNNYHFVADSPAPSNTEEGFLKDGSYAFWVIE